MKGITNFDSSEPREKIIKYKIESSREFEVRYLSSLYKKDYKIIDPIKLLIENPKTDKDDYIIEIEDGEFFLWSIGKTLEKAVREIRLLLIGLYEGVLHQHDNDSMPVLVDTKKFLEKHIEKYWQTFRPFMGYRSSDKS